MSIITNLKRVDAFGFHSIPNKIVQDEDEKTLDNSIEIKVKKFSNITNPLGWIPVIGTIVGLVRIILFAAAISYINGNYKTTKDTTNVIKLYKIEVARGICELTSLGFLLAFADIPITIARYYGKA